MATRNIVRNFEVCGIVDGRANPATIKTVKKEAGFDLNLSMKDRGEALLVANIKGVVDGDNLVLTITDAEGNVLKTVETVKDAPKQPKAKKPSNASKKVPTKKKKEAVIVEDEEEEDFNVDDLGDFEEGDFEDDE